MKRKKKRYSGVAVDSMEHWEVEEDLRAVARAEAVRKDPERMKKVKVLAKEKLDESKRREQEAKTMVNLGEGKDI
ncbi:MAG: hypothetical protein KKF27_20340 [Gammaproteobacteria bacterium]|nr:hypothetical protein [Gammaproteobacteria bacterium]